MKKIYIVPQMEVFDLDPEAALNTLNTGSGNDSDSGNGADMVRKRTVTTSFGSPLWSDMNSSSK